MALGACTWTGHGLSNVSTGATLPLVTSLLECYFFKLGFFFFFFFSKEVIWASQHALA